MLAGVRRSTCEPIRLLRPTSYHRGVSIHSEHPFTVPVDQRDPVRRLRGRLAAPVTVLTAGTENPAGLTVSSVLVVEGEPARVMSIVGVGSDFLDAATASEAFVAHVLGADHGPLADVFAGLRPSPGGMFAGRDTEATEWGPRLVEVADWAGCHLEEARPAGDQMLVVGSIQRLELSDLTDPLVYFRGGYRRLRS